MTNCFTFPDRFARGNPDTIFGAHSAHEPLRENIELRSPARPTTLFGVPCSVFGLSGSWRAALVLRPRAESTSVPASRTKMSPRSRGESITLQIGRGRLP